MLHARLFKEQARFRDAHFQPVKESLTSKVKSDSNPFLDGNPTIDRPLFVQFCANKPDDFLEAAEYVAPYCDAVDLNLGCPQGIARSGHYGAFLQEDWETIHNMIRKLRDNLSVPVTAKMRILDTKEETLQYAKMILNAGASILTVHGRRREQKGHNTGVADWSMIRYLRDNLPPDTVLFANGNILNYADLEPCLEATGADGVMSAEGNLSDPTIFARPPEKADVASQREYWRDPRKPSIGGYRVDGVLRRYLDIIYRYVLEQEPPHRLPLYFPDDQDCLEASNAQKAAEPCISSNNDATTHIPENRKSEIVDDDRYQDNFSRPSKKAKHRHEKKAQSAAAHNPNLKSMQGHLFQLLRSMLSDHVPIRDALAKARAGDIQAFENVLTLVEEAVKKGLDEEHAFLHNDASGSSTNQEICLHGNQESVNGDVDDTESSARTRAKYKRPFWICQPHIRPLPSEAIKIGAMTLSKKNKEKAAQNSLLENAEGETKSSMSQAAITASLSNIQTTHEADNITHELPKEEALACG